MSMQPAQIRLSGIYKTKEAMKLGEGGAECEGMDLGRVRKRSWG